MDKGKELIPIFGTPPSLLNPPIGCPFCARCEYAMRICKDHCPQLENLEQYHQVACWLKRKNEENIG